MFTSLIKRLPSLPTVQTLRFKAAKPNLEDDYILVDLDAHDISRSVSLSDALQSPAAKSGATPTREHIYFWCYETDVKSINQQIAHASYNGVKHLFDNKPTVYTPDVLHSGSVSRFGKSFEEAKAKAMDGLRQAAASANALLDNMLSFDPRLEGASAAAQIEQSLAAQWQESLEGNITDRFVTSVKEDPKKDLVDLQWSGKLVVKNGRFVPALEATATQQLPMFSALSP